MLEFGYPLDQYTTHKTPKKIYENFFFLRAERFEDCPKKKVMRAKGFEPLQENPMRRLTGFTNQKEIIQFLESEICNVRHMRIDQGAV